MKKFMFATKRKTKKAKVYKMIRVLVLGAAAVGKSCLIQRLLENSYTEEYQKTVYEVYEKQLDCEHGCFMFEFTDIGGDHSFPAMRDLALSKSDLCLVVYDITNNRSFEEVGSLVNELLITEEKIGKEIPLVLVGNKIDIDHTKHTVFRNSKIAELEEICLSHILTSAALGLNVSNLFKTLTAESESLNLSGNGFDLKRQISGQYIVRK